MLNVRLNAIPLIPASGTKNHEMTSKLNSEKAETAVLIFIFPTAESRFPYRFRKSMLRQKASNNKAKMSELSAYSALKKRCRISSFQKKPTAKMMIVSGIKIL
jgi:hypothetical protein